MPWEDPDPQDPMMLVGVSLPAGESSEETQREMAYAFAEEFARIGYSGKQILALFRKPFYAGAYGARAELGDGEIARIVDETVAVWGRARAVERDSGALRVLPDSIGVKP